MLGTVEGFSVADAAAILGVTEEEVEALVREAGREIAERVATDVLIIEDELLIAQDIEFIARDLGHRVIGVARTHQAVVELAKRQRPGLILADIQLTDGSSELCWIFGDGLNQAADFSLLGTSMPSRNVTPLTTFGN
ncbi:MAG: hypothetical protein ACR65T_00010 [Methylocystis sp.]|uniref:hypothetical protein n=1 Tax=Methylocystis sp. TaxID=1911079 RepID=UPI003DA222DA